MNQKLFNAEALLREYAEDLANAARQGGTSSRIISLEMNSEAVSDIADKILSIRAGLPALASEIKPFAQPDFQHMVEQMDIANELTKQTCMFTERMCAAQEQIAMAIIELRGSKPK